MLRLVETWAVASLTGTDVPADKRHRPWLTFEGDGVVYGMSGVNRVRGTWSVEGDDLTFGPLVSTLMAGLADAMAIESALQRTLSGELRLSTPDGAPQPTQDPRDGADAGGTLDRVELSRDGVVVELERLAGPPS
ncbi:META domain-containing protein [Cellulomonas sp. HZM]|uniref:META domain-containing protein n=1 Tax=Cellulomonas sp. HZM TaxID=1454010 RepID=UPI00049338E2|nr:META domain-containing protein [Cellulomonas sp. HZM]